MKLYKLFAIAMVLYCFFAYEAKAVTTIELIGDSITYGAVSGPDPAPGLEYSFGGLLVGSLGPEYSVINVACSGSFSRQWTPAAPITAPLLCSGGFPVSGNLFNGKVVPVDIAVVMLGTNDAGGYPCCAPIPTVEYEENIRSIVNGLIHSGVGRVILMSAPPRPEIGLIGNSTITAYLSEYRDAVMNTCVAVPNVYCIDVFADMTPHVLEYFYYGGPLGADLHPNIAGHAAIHQLLHDKIITLPEPGSLVLLGSGIVGLALLNKLPR